MSIAQTIGKGVQKAAACIGLQTAKPRTMQIMVAAAGVTDQFISENDFLGTASNALSVAALAYKP